MPRTLCPNCQRPTNYCYCAQITSEYADIDLVILQHPKETRHPMNTARIAELGIKNCDIWVGEDFTDHQPLQELIHHTQCYLLFPGPKAQDSQQILQQQKPETLIIIDGTWRKARRIYHCNALLHTLPALSLNHDQLSGYRIRKAPSDKALSTIEAIVFLLRQASQSPEAHQSLLDAFNHMIQMQIHTMGEEVYQKNYGHRVQSCNLKEPEA